MRRAFLPLLAAILLVGVACSSDESGNTLASEVTVEALFDGTTCSITESDPGYVPAEEEGLDLVSAAPDASLTFVVTNTSGENLTGLVNRFDPALSTTEALALTEALGDVDGTMFDRPEFILGPALVDYGAEQGSLDENQLRYHYTLQPGMSNTIVYTDDGIWNCNTSPEVLSLIDVPQTESTSS